MKKNGRKYRKVQKEKAKKHIEYLKSCGEPYAKRKIRNCCHYLALRVVDGNIFLKTYLSLISDSKCHCEICKKEFSIEVYEKAQKYIDGMTGSISKMERLLYKKVKLKPTKYYYTAKDVIEYVPETEDMNKSDSIRVFTFRSQLNRFHKRLLDVYYRTGWEYE